MEFDDENWAGLTGGYRRPYDPRGALRRLEGPEPEEAWRELWEELHHQGDVGTASYAAVPYLVRIHRARGTSDANTYRLLSVIEEARLNPRNPDIPPNLRGAYDEAWVAIVEAGLAELAEAPDVDLVGSIIGAIAMRSGLRMLGRFAYAFNEEERSGILAASGWA